MLSTLIGSRLPQKYRKYFKLPDQPESWKVDETFDTVLGRAASRWLASRDKPCGVFRLNLGLDALGVRLGLIQHAERTIDIQSYLISDDLSGNLIAMKLVEAADRVRQFGPKKVLQPRLRKRRVGQGMHIRASRRHIC